MKIALALEYKQLIIGKLTPQKYPGKLELGAEAYN